jgi:hypothetical protein
MSELISAALGVLTSFRGEVAGWTNQGMLKTVDDHIAQIQNAAELDVHAGETAVKEVFAELYGAFHGHTAAAAAPAAPVEASVAPPATVTSVPAPTETAPPATAPADPTPAPSTTTEGSSAPSSTPSTSTPATDTTAAPAA